MMATFTILRKTGGKRLGVARSGMTVEEVGPKTTKLHLQSSKESWTVEGSFDEVIFNLERASG